MSLKGIRVTNPLKTSIALKKLYKEHPDKVCRGIRHAQAVGNGTRGKYRKELFSILDLSSRTVRKVLIRLELPCSFCGYDEIVCDLHHIFGRHVPNANCHSNLCYLCPNCHRLADEGIIPTEWLTPISAYFPEDWKERYFG